MVIKLICQIESKIYFPFDADSGLLALRKAISIAEKRHPAANEFEQKEKLINHDCVTTRKRFIGMFPINGEFIKGSLVYTKQSGIIFGCFGREIHSVISLKSVRMSHG